MESRYILEIKQKVFGDLLGGEDGVCFSDDFFGFGIYYQVDGFVYYNKVYEREYLLELFNLRFFQDM